MIKKNKKNIKDDSPGKIKKVKKIIFFFLLLIFFIVFIWVIFFSFLVKVKNINIIGFQEDIANEIVSGVIDSKYLGILPQDNIILLSSSRIRNKLQEEMILAQDIDVKKIFPSSIDVVYLERKDVIIWCSDDNRSDCFLMDENGVAFYQLKGNEFFDKEFPIVLDKGNFEVEINSVAVKPELVKFCFEISDSLLNETDIELDSNEYYTPSFMSGEIKVKTKQGWDIYFNSFSTAHRQAILLKTVLSEDVKTENLSKLEYIDLRLDGKVLYKLRGDNSEESQDDNEKSDEDDSDE